MRVRVYVLHEEAPLYNEREFRIIGVYKNKSRAEQEITNIKNRDRVILGLNRGRKYHISEQDFVE